jgi:4-hydroxy-tetrahydrodipicolinate synthase
MIRTEQPPFGRLLTAMVTPFDDQLKLDHKAIVRLTEHLIGIGTETFVVAGTTGESPTLDATEKLELLRAVIKAAGGKAKIIMGTGYNDTAKTAKAAKEAEQEGADGILVVAPYYNKPSQQGLLRHFETVAKATALPMIVYNIPGRTGVNITAQTMLQLTQMVDTVHALKDSTGSVEQSAEIAGKARDDFRIYSGDDYLTLPFLSIGASGIVSVASHFAGKRIQKMMTSFFANDLNQARSLHYELLPLFKGLFAAPNPTCTKYGLSRLGICSEHLRLPLIPLEPTERAAMDDVLKQCNIIAELSRA